jgi:phage gp45-like
MHSAEWVRRLLQPVFARVRALASRGVVQLSNDGRRAQTLQIIVDAGPPLDSVERFGEFGFVSRPPKGAEVLVICLGGDRSHPIAVATEYRDARPQGLAEGEAGLYSTSGGSVVARITVRADGSVEITAGTVTISGDVVVAGDVSDPAGSMAEMRQIFNLHTHHHGGAAGETNPPTQPMV